MKPFTNGFHQAGVTVFNIVLSSGGDHTSSQWRPSSSRRTDWPPATVSENAPRYLRARFPLSLEETEVALSPPGEGASELGHGTPGICLSGRLNTALFEKGGVQSFLRTPQGDAVISPLGKMLSEEVSKANAEESCWGSRRRRQEAGSWALQQNASPILAIGQGPWQGPLLTEELFRGCFSLKEQKQSSSPHVCQPAGALGSVQLRSSLQRGLGGHARASALDSLKDHSVRPSSARPRCPSLIQISLVWVHPSCKKGNQPLPGTCQITASPWSLPTASFTGLTKLQRRHSNWGSRLTFAQLLSKLQWSSISCARLPREPCSVWSQTGWAQRQCWPQKGGNRDSVLVGGEVFAYTKPKKWQGVPAWVQEEVRTWELIDSPACHQFGACGLSWFRLG